MDEQLTQDERDWLIELEGEFWCHRCNAGTDKSPFATVEDCNLEMLRRAFRHGQESMLPPIDIQEVIERIQAESEK